MEQSIVPTRHGQIRSTKPAHPRHLTNFFDLVLKQRSLNLFQQRLSFRKAQPEIFFSSINCTAFHCTKLMRPLLTPAKFRLYFDTNFHRQTSFKSRRLTDHPSVSPDLFHSPVTLAAIAYHQPITRDRLKDIFGKEISRDLIGRLHARGLIGTGPRSPRRGAPYTFVTTEKFLSAFDLESLQDLPDREHLEDAGVAGEGPQVDFG